MTNVSAIISAYNCPNLKLKADNLLATTLAKQERLEIVIVDSASPNPNDGRVMRWLLNEYPHTRVIVSAARIPVYQAWNIGIQAATSEWIVNSNADDMVTKTAYEDMLIAGANADVVYANWRCVTEINNPDSPYLEQVEFYPAGTSPYANWEFSPSRLAAFCHWSCGVMWRKVLHQKVGWFDPSFSICGDYDMWCRFTLAGARVKALPIYVGYWHFDPSRSNISFSDPAQFDYEVRRIKLKYAQRLMEMSNG